MKSKYDNIFKMLEKYGMQDELFEYANYKTIMNNFRLIKNRLYNLFEVPDSERGSNNIDSKLFVLIEFETFLHHSNIEYRNTRKALINKLRLEPAFTSCTEVEAFFMPYFTNDAFALNKTIYFINLKTKLYEFLNFYKCLSETAKSSAQFKYVIDDLKAFIKCLYTQEPLPQRDYKVSVKSLAYL